MKKIVLALLIAFTCQPLLAQPKQIVGTYKISSLKMDNNTIFSKANADSIIRAAIDLAFAEGQKNGGEPLTKEDSLQIINDKTNFFEGIMSLTIQLKADSKFVKTMKYSFSNKAEVIESGTFKYNTKNGIITFNSKEVKENSAKQIVKYDAKTKNMNFIAGPNEEDAGDTILTFKKVK